jgi:hypothetical protein
MKNHILKLMVCATLAAGFFSVAQFLVIPALLPTGLAAWGSLCFLFASQLSAPRLSLASGRIFANQ